MRSKRGNLRTCMGEISLAGPMGSDMAWVIEGASRAWPAIATPVVPMPIAAEVHSA